MSHVIHCNFNALTYSFGYIGNKCFYLSDFSFVDGNIQYVVYVCSKGYSGDWFIVEIDSKQYATNNVWGCGDSGTERKKFGGKIISGPLSSKPDGVEVFDGFNAFDIEKRNLIKKDVIARYLKEQDERQAREEAYERARNNFYRYRKMMLFLGPNGDTWQSRMLFNSQTKKYELYHYVDGQIWENIDNVTEFEDLSSAVNYLKEHIVLRDVRHPRNILDCTIYDSEDSEESDGYEEPRSLFNCQSYGKKMLEALQLEFQHTFNKKKNVDRSDNYPHYKPGKDFWFSI
ncbi:MAG: hypothetical protein Harvfovirus14_5 [Harvfovirus sp.]|uniref:Uncharacterized protein n=1 Tax=Harvfovirus sp. TaxID=2487768 RepID=A0A3G5A3H3_9VIRU|nr:MAG: hypothetical protein Harvfovirus14_5 [Harvfovirus sp.]